MKTRLLLICLLASALAVSVKGKPHGKHQALPKSSHTAKEKDIVPDEANEGEVLPTFMTFESSSQEQEDEDMSYENNANANVGPSNKEGVFEVSDSGERSTPILLSDKALVDLLQGVSEEEEVEEEEEGQIESEEAQSEEEEEEEEEEGEEEEGYLEKEEEKEEVVEVEAESEKEEEAEKVKVIADEEESVEEEVEEEEEESVEEEVEEEEESVEEEVEEEEESVEEEVEEEEESVEEEVEEEESVEEEVEEEEEEEEREKEEEEGPVVGDGGVEEEAEVEETDSNTESEIPVDLDYAGDSDNTQPLETEPEEGKPLAVDAQLLSNKEEDAKAEEREEQASKEGEIPTATDGYESQQDVQDAESSEKQEVLSLDKLSEGSKDQEKGSEGDSQEKGTNTKDADADAELRETKNNVDLDGTRLSVEEGEEQEERNINESASHTKGKARKQRKNQRVKKHPPQRDEAPPGEGVPDHLGDREGEREHYRTTDNAVYKPKRRRAGKWTPLVGMNPVQIRATVDLYPSARPSLAASLYRPQASAADPCENFRCKRGKACKLNEEKKPTCVCQEPSACPQSVTDYDHVCGTDNVTYDTSCELFATKCNLEGTKRGHRLHLDYTGPCKFIAPCMDAELVQFPLRMRDWLKNVLLQLYEHDSVSHGFLTPKQRIRVRKIHESERRLRAGDHPIELLTQDFEKNYNMYIYPVHWQFAQMDQHPSDRFLSHSELAPLRVPLVPMEHCTSRFFQECEADKDKQVSFREWARCFGIKDEDMDVNLLF